MSDNEALSRAAQQGDAGAMFELADDCERRAQALRREAREWYRRGALAGSLDATLALARIAVQDGDYEEGQWQLRDGKRRHEGVRPGRLVAVAPDALGPLSLDGDGDADWPGAGVFTVISAHPRRAAVAIERVANRLMDVDEHGVLHAPDEDYAGDAYTPNYLHTLQWCDRGVMVVLDTKGWMSAAMGRTMIGILTDALVTDCVPAVITGYRGDLKSEWNDWEASDEDA
jgi:hypothetical protein